MKKTMDVIGIVGLLLAIFTLLFGDNLYGQITGRSLFNKNSSHPALVLPTFTSQVTYQTPTSTLTPAPSRTPTITPTFASTLTPTPKFITLFPTSDVPNTYTMQNGEFGFCIARRFNVDPDEFHQLNGISGGVLWVGGTTVKIPTTGNPFPGNRALRNHPAQYTVTSSGETFYSIACVFGDVFPENIASLNELPVNSALEVGQVLQIP